MNSLEHSAINGTLKLSTVRIYQGGFFNVGLSLQVCELDLSSRRWDSFLLAVGFLRCYDLNMNNAQLKHIVIVLHAIAVGLFAVFGYTGLTAQPVHWLLVANRFCGIGFCEY